MTTSKSAEVARRRALPPAEATFAADFARELRLVHVRATSLQFPSDRYQQDPVRFFAEVLGFEPWSEQIKVIEAVRDHTRVAVCSGHKIGKSNLIAGLALWFYCSFQDARAIMSSTTARQVDQILWRELRMIRARSGRCVACKAADPDGRRIPRPCPHSTLIEGDEGELARTGLKSTDFREVVGFTAREAEAVAGVSGRNLLYLLDEASGIPDLIFEAIEGNRAGGARILLAGNGTRNEGEFFEAFNSKSHLYKTIRISSESTPNVIEGKHVIPGLATREWIEEKKLEWGVDSSLYRVRVKGDHATFEAGKLISLHMIGESERRWHETPETGRLFIGVDPAGESGSGDESVFVARRGQKMISLRAMQGLSAASHLVHLLGMIRTFRLPRETPVVVFDKGGPIGTDLGRVLREYLTDNEGAFDVVGVRPSDAAIRQSQNYHLIRDELAANLEQWIRDGGAILEDAKLAKELHALEMREDIRERRKLIPKTELRKLLGRSPDRYDALSLSVWEPLSLRAELPLATQNELAIQPARYGMPTIDPYAGAALWNK